MPFSIPRPRRAFVTGATGFLGSHFLLARAGQSAPTTLLARAQSADHAFERVRDQLRRARAGYATGPAPEQALAQARCVRGDLAERFCGLDAERRAQTGEIDDFWHFAATLDYRESKAEEISDCNLRGTEHALELARELGARRFVYVSTAYTVGRRSGWVAERLHPLDAAFNNAYERTKCQAEHAVTEAAGRMGLELQIVRPGIVIGISQTGRPGGTDTGLYGLAQIFAHLAGRIARRPEDLVIDADPLTPVHLIPVDLAVRDLLALERRDFAGGPLHHVTGAGSLTVREVIDALSASLDLPRLRFAEPGCRADSLPNTALQRRFDRGAAYFLDYLRHPKRFLRRLPGEPAVSAAELDGYLGHFLDESGLDRRLGQRSAV